jgi:hypothetical protein
MSNDQTPLACERKHDSGMSSGPRYSILPARAVFDKRLTNADKVVLAALGTYTNGEGWCWPSQKELTDKLDIARSTVCAAIKKLSSSDIGYLEVAPRTTKGRGKVGNQYRVKLDLKPMSEQQDIGKKPMSSRSDIGEQVIEVAPMSCMSDNGADVRLAGHPMSDGSDIAYNRRTGPTERTQLVSNETNVCSPEPSAYEKAVAAKQAPLKAATKKLIPYTKDFEAIWLSWPKNRRNNSDKRKAFDRYRGGVELYGIESINKAAKRYLSLPDTRKDQWKYCCLVEVFMNGKLEAAVEAINDPLPKPGPSANKRSGIPRFVY